MDFRQIEAFVHVYRLRNFSRAGDALYLTQPTISSHINCLESELRIKLFDRSSKDVIPTEAGCIFYQYAVNLLETRDSAIFSLNQNGEKIEGRLEIAASTIPSQYLLPRILDDFHNIYPDIFFIVHQYDTREVIRKLQDKKYQLGIVGTQINRKNLEYEFLTSDRLVLISAIDNTQFPQKKLLSLESLKDCQFILREPGSGTRLEFETALKKHGISPDSLKVVAEMNSNEAIKYAVREGLGVSVVSFLSVKDYIESGFVQALTIEGLDMERAFYLVSHRKRLLSPSLAAFREHILEYYKHKKTVHT
jgi:DNA-binding transcriptional LysR family regulator